MGYFIQLLQDIFLLSELPQDTAAIHSFKFRGCDECKPTMNAMKIVYEFTVSKRNNNIFNSFETTRVTFIY